MRALDRRSRRAKDRRFVRECAKTRVGVQRRLPRRASGRALGRRRRRSLCLRLRSFRLRRFRLRRAVRVPVNVSRHLLDPALHRRRRRLSLANSASVIDAAREKWTACRRERSPATVLERRRCAFSRAAAIHSRTAALPASCTLLQEPEGAIARRGEASPFFEEEKGGRRSSPRSCSRWCAASRQGAAVGRERRPRRRPAPRGAARRPSLSVAPVLSDLNTSHSGSATFTLLRSGSSAARARPPVAALIPVFIPRISALSSGRGARRCPPSSAPGSRASSTRCVALGILAGARRRARDEALRRCQEPLRIARRCRRP